MNAKEIIEKFNVNKKSECSYICRHIINELKMMADYCEKIEDIKIKIPQKNQGKKSVLTDVDFKYLESNGYIVQKAKTFAGQNSEKEGPIYADDREYKISLPE